MRRRIWSELGQHVTLLALVMIATWAGYNSGTSITLPALIDVPGHFGDLQELEPSEQGPFRWTDGNAQVCAPQAGRAQRSVVMVQLAGDYALALGVSEATLRPNQGAGVSVPLPRQVRRYTLLTGADQQPHDGLCLTITSAAVPDPNSNRNLGVQFYGFSAAHLPAAGPVWPAVGQLCLNAALALVAFWLMRLLAVPALAAAMTTGVGVVLAGFAASTGLVPPGAGVARFSLVVLGGLGATLAGLIGALALRKIRLPMQDYDLLGIAFWVTVLVNAVRLSQWANDHRGAWPLKAGIDPHWTALVLLPITLFLGWLWLLLRPLPGETDAVQGAVVKPTLSVLITRFGLLALGAVVVPVALEVAVLGWDSLYSVFRDSPYDYLRDTWRVAGDPVGFLGRYVEATGTLALHTSTHPPGSVLLLWMVEQICGPGPIATSWAAILLSAFGVVAALWLGWRLGGLRLGLLAGALSVAMPGYLVYTVTSMDGLFNALLALAAVAFFLCLEPPARPLAAVGAGTLAALALFFTYAATQLVFFGLVAVILALVRHRAITQRFKALRQSVIAGVTLGSIYLALFLLTGFNVIAGSRTATAENALRMGRAMFGQISQPFLPPSFGYYLDFLDTNAVAFFVYLTPWGLAAVSSALLAGAARRWRSLDAYDALLLSAGGCLLGMWLSGLFNREVERIWGFLYPLAAVLVARHALQGNEQAQRWRSWLFPALFFAQGILIKLLLNTGW